MESPRLEIRESTFEDLEYFARWERDRDVTEFFTIDEGKTYEMTVREFYERLKDVSKKQFTICLKETARPIGRIYISAIDAHYDSLDITRIYIAQKTMRGNGYGEEALRLILDWAFNEMNCERVTLDYFTNNAAAASLYKKIGFTDEGVMRRGGKKNGEYVDLCLMSFLREEYMEKLKE